MASHLPIGPVLASSEAGIDSMMFYSDVLIKNRAWMAFDGSCALRMQQRESCVAAADVSIDCFLDTPAVT